MTVGPTALEAITVTGQSSIPKVIKRATRALSKLNTDNARWARSGDKFILAERTSETLQSGVYHTHISSEGVPYLQDAEYSTDELLHFVSSPSEAMLKEFDAFWQSRDHFLQRKMMFKRSFLLVGPPGTGKTSTIYMICDKIVNEMNGLAFVIQDPHIAGICLAMVRRIEPGRPIIAIAEDLDVLTANRAIESGYLTLLDGQLGLDNIIFISTANNPENMSPRLINRPSRIDTIITIDTPSYDQRLAYLKAKEPDLIDAERWAKDTDKMSFAHLKELVIGVKVFGRGYAETLNRLRTMYTKPVSSEFFMQLNEDDDENSIAVGFNTPSAKKFP